MGGITFHPALRVVGGRFPTTHQDARRGTNSVWKLLANQWALVTGPSSGLGEEFARQLAARGMHLVLVARRRELMEKLAAELHLQHGTRCHIIQADLADPAVPKRVLDEVAAQGITIELLVNNAGFGIVGEVDNADIDRMLLMIRLNISALTELTYRLLPGMLQRGRGAILNVSSLSAFQPVAYMGVYAASKAFVLHFSEALHCELKDRGITVTAVCAGVTRTPFFDIAGASGWLQKHASHPVDYVVKRSLKALVRRQQFTVPGWRNYLLTLLVRIASRARVVKESTRFFRPRRKGKAVTGPPKIG
jgi:short-subunit dehydrogenase